MSYINVAVIIGSTREKRFAKTVSDWFINRAEVQKGVQLDLIDLEDAKLPAVLPYENDAATEAYVQRIARADAFVMITPEYNHSYPASLKQAIDVAQKEWHAKPVAFVSYGGMGVVSAQSSTCVPCYPRFTPRLSAIPLACTTCGACSMSMGPLLSRRDTTSPWTPCSNN